MAVIPIVATDVGDATIRWEVPQDNRLNESPIPRGLRVYQGALAVAALGAGDQTNVAITFTFPTAFNYLCKSVTITFASDDLTSEFSNFGSLEYRPGGATGIGGRTMYGLVCNGASFRAAVRSEQTYRPLGTWRRWLMGSLDDAMALHIADISGDASTAGDVVWSAEFWEFDIEQCLKWPVNTPQPTIAY